MERRLPPTKTGVQPELLDHPYNRRPRSRRDFLKLAGGAAVGLAMADTAAGELCWQGSVPEIRRYHNAEAERKFPETYVLVIGGFGISDVRSIAGAVDSCLSDYGQTAYLHNSNDGFNINNVKREAREFVEKNGAERLIIYGHSMGGMVGTELAADLAELTEIEALVLDCSPASYHDVRDQERFGTWLLDAFNDLSLHFGPGARFMMEAARPLLDGRDDYAEICRHALSKLSPDSCSNQLIQDYASYLRGFEVEDFAGKIPAETRIIRLAPDDYARDGTVNNQSSLPRWRDGLQHDVIDARIKDGSHASPKKYTEEYSRVLHRLAVEYGFYDGTPKRHEQLDLIT